MACETIKKLAIDGGIAVNTKPFPLWPEYSGKTYQMLAEPLRTAKLNYWSGPYGKKFEQELADWHQAKYCVTTVNEYGAFHMALAALGVIPGDEVICPSYIYFPPIFAILQLGALPIFIDVDYSHTIDPKLIEEKITDKTKAIVVGHMYGIVGDMGPVMDIARKHGLKVLEDCTTHHHDCNRKRNLHKFVLHFTVCFNLTNNYFEFPFTINRRGDLFAL